MSSTRVGGNGSLWKNYVVSRDASLPWNGCLTNSSGGECDLLWVFPFQRVSAVCRSGDGSLQASLPGCPAKSSERIGRDDHNELLDRSSGANISRGKWSLLNLLAPHSIVDVGLVSQFRCAKLPQDNKSGGMLLETYLEMCH
jgi:hypothetical protein